MKRFISAVLALAIFLSLAAFFASADAQKPFEFKAPTNIAASLAGTDSPTTVQLAITLDNSIAEFYSKKEAAILAEKSEEFWKPYGVEDIDVRIQYDWALDDVNDPVSGWHYTKYWDGTENESHSLGQDSDYRYRTSDWDGVDVPLNNATETVQSYWVTRGVPNGERWNGNKELGLPGVKDQLNPGQYTYDTEADTVVIDFSEHTFYFRARLVKIEYYTDAGGNYVSRTSFTDWSSVCSVGKDAAKIEPIKNGEIAAPVITGLRRTDKTFNGNPVVAFTLTVPDELHTQLTRASALGGSIRIFTEARVKGDTEWTVMSNTDSTVTPGEMECALLHLVNEERPTIPEDTVIELRCRYCCDQPGQDDIYSDYSKIISFGTDDINSGKTPLDDGNPSGVDDKCPICHFCPQPLGICIFIWLLIIILVIVVIVVIICVAKKKDKKKDQDNK
ncbi:MAG: hypothetical protein ILO42_02470 [Clostridia bacterium]|nr:hypothetical protein [Clostridia bacterium]